MEKIKNWLKINIICWLKKISDVLGDVGVDETLPKKVDDEKIKGLVETIVYYVTVSECKKLWYLIHNVVGRNMTVLSQIGYYNVRK